MKLIPLQRKVDGVKFTDPLGLVSEDRIISQAIFILQHRLAKGPLLGSPRAVRDYLMLKLSALEYEIFGALFLDAQLQLIEQCELFRGTVTQTSVYPREVVKMALKFNASALIIYHNHPSGVCEPSRADELLTQSLKSSLSLVDVKILDHLVVASQGVTSFAERGLL
jgi:DNA repair protein RadC